MPDCNACINFCRVEADKFKRFISEHKDDRMYFDLIPYWQKMAEMYEAMVRYISLGAKGEHNDTR